MLLNYTLNMVKVINFMLSILTTIKSSEYIFYPILKYLQITYIQKAVTKDQIF